MRGVLRRVTATRYVTPLREGGSLPGLVEADDDGLYVVKFRGAGQGAKTLVAEIVCAELGRALGLPVPELVEVEIDPALAHAEPDPEIQELIQASGGVNVGVDFLPGSLAYSPACEPRPDAALAADVVWFDGLVTNVDRTPRNPNLLVWHGRVWLIDHGAALYRQHGDFDPVADGRRGFPLIAQHVLLPVAGSIVEADERLAAQVDDALLERVVGMVPDALLEGGPPREAYVDHLRARLDAPRGFVEEAERARA